MPQPHHPIQHRAWETAFRISRKLQRDLPPALAPLATAVGLPELRDWLQHQAHQTRQRDLAQVRPAIDQQALAAGLRGLGLPANRIVFVHSSLKALGFVQGGPAAVVEALVAVIVGELGGTLALPTFSMQGSMVDSLRGGAVFDAATTPSVVGAITELFRHRPGVVRSLHPTHSVAALGPEAAWLCGEHHTCGSNFGTGSPLGRLLEHNGILMGLGTTLGPVTFYHVLEDLRPDFPLQVYSKDSPLVSRVRDSNGAEFTMPAWGHDSEVGRHRIDKENGVDIRRYITGYLDDTQRLRWGTVGVAPTWWLPTAEMYTALEELLGKGITIYTEMPDLRDDGAAAAAGRPQPDPVQHKIRGVARIVARPVRGLRSELLLSGAARSRRARDHAGLPAHDVGPAAAVDAMLT